VAETNTEIILKIIGDNKDAVRALIDVERQSNKTAQTTQAANQNVEKSVNKSRETFQKLSGAMSQAGIATGGLGTAVGILMTVLSAASSPIGLVIAGLSALIATLSIVFDKTKITAEKLQEMNKSYQSITNSIKENEKKLKQLASGNEAYRIILEGVIAADKKKAEQEKNLILTTTSKRIKQIEDEIEKRERNIKSLKEENNILMKTYGQYNQFATKKIADNEKSIKSINELNKSQRKELEGLKEQIKTGITLGDVMTEQIDDVGQKTEEFYKDKFVLTDIDELYTQRNRNLWSEYGDDIEKNVITIDKATGKIKTYHKKQVDEVIALRLEKLKAEQEEKNLSSAKRQALAEEHEEAIKFANEREKMLEARKQKELEVANAIANEAGNVARIIVDGWRAGESAADIFKKVLDRIVQSLIEMAIQLLIIKPLLALLTGGSSGVVGGIISLFGLNKGGRVPGYASGGNVDTVPAMLTPGEFVLNKAAAEANPVSANMINSGLQMDKLLNGIGSLMESGLSGGGQTVNIGMAITPKDLTQRTIIPMMDNIGKRNISRDFRVIK
jgi:hypothetical protein